jgi:hypothetical protein
MARRTVVRVASHGPHSALPSTPFSAECRRCGTVCTAGGEVYRIGVDGAHRKLFSDRTSSRDAKKSFCCAQQRGFACGCFARTANAPRAPRSVTSHHHAATSQSPSLSTSQSTGQSSSRSAARQGDAVELHIFVDASSVEVFVDGASAVHHSDDVAGALRVSPH